MRERRSIKSDISKVDMWKHYSKTANTPVERKVYDKVFKELFTSLSETIVREASTIKLNNLGRFRIRAIKPKLLDTNGELRKGKLKPDWKKTWEYWRKTYAGESDEEIIKRENKQLFYHMNNHSDGYVYGMYWDKVTSTVKGKSFYKFKAVRKYNRLRADLIINHNMTYYE